MSPVEGYCEEGAAEKALVLDDAADSHSDEDESDVDYSSRLVASR